MYSKSARYYDALYRSKDYAAASRQVHDQIQRRHAGARTLLDVGCGTAKHLEWLRNDYAVEGLDLSPEMLEIARTRCPGVPFHQGDMVSFDLGRTFDAVTCLFSAIGSVQTLENLRRALATMARHTNAGGVVIVEPWFSPANYRAGTLVANLVDEPELKIAWMYKMEREDRTSRLDIHYLAGTPDGIEHFVERRELGLFTQEEYIDALRNAGLEAEYEPDAVFGRGSYIGVKTT